MGWGVSSNGKIIYTGTAGVAWTEQVSNTFDFLKDVFFINAQIGWIVGSGGKVLKTVNGGYTPPSSINELTGEAFLRINPNPSNGYIFIESMLLNAGDLSIEITDLCGKRVFEKHYGTVPPSFSTRIDLMHLNKGIYIIRGRNGSNTMTRKLIIR